MPIRINEAIYGLRMPSDYERQQIGAYLAKYARAYNPTIYGIGIFFAVIGFGLVIRGASSLLKAEYAGSLFTA